MFFDSHAHLDDVRFDVDREEIIASLQLNNVSMLINVGTTLRLSEKSVEMAEKYPFIYATAGIHPHDTKNMNEETLNSIKELLKHPKCVALGEIGLDYHYDFSDKDTQRYWFDRQLKLARDLNKPVIIHDREAHSECFEMVKDNGVKGVFHCYSGAAELAEELIKLGFYISFTGGITFKNAKKAVEVIDAIPLSKILIETDCPYLTPEPFRSKRNEPKHVMYTAKKIAEIKNMSLEEIAKITLENAKRCFSIN